MPKLPKSWFFVDFLTWMIKTNGSEISLDEKIWVPITINSCSAHQPWIGWFFGHPEQEQRYFEHSAVSSALSVISETFEIFRQRSVPGLSIPNESIIISCMSLGLAWPLSPSLVPIKQSSFSVPRLLWVSKIWNICKVGIIYIDLVVESRW